MNGDVVCAECQRVVPQENTIHYGEAFVCASCKPVFVQRLREGVTVPVGQLVYAGFWVRCWATIVDTILIEIVILPIMVWVYGWKYYTGGDVGFFAGWVDVLVGWIFPVIAIVGFWSYKQATPGKMLFGLKIIDARTGERPRIGQFIVRYLMYIPSVLLLGVGLISVALDKRKQGWHDKVARTVVIRTKRGRA
jgi:uncharacterized RDD family membrane protein YckC